MGYKRNCPRENIKIIVKDHGQTCPTPVVSHHEWWLMFPPANVMQKKEASQLAAWPHDQDSTIWLQLRTNAIEAGLGLTMGLSGDHLSGELKNRESPIGRKLENLLIELLGLKVK